VPSEAVTRIVVTPTSPSPGTPVKLRDFGSKESQAGRGAPSARVAE
jgi:hypothetical protein